MYAEHNFYDQNRTCYVDAYIKCLMNLRKCSATKYSCHNFLLNTEMQT